MRWLLVIVIAAMGMFEGHSQALVQTYTDRCTGEVKVFTVQMGGSTVVAYYNRSRVFTSTEFTNGTLQAWLEDTYAWYQALSPCSSGNATSQTTQQTTNQATTNATNAANNATSNTGTTNTGTTNTNTGNGNTGNTGSSGGTGSSSGSSNSGSSGSSSSNGSSGGDSGSSSSGNDGGGSSSGDSDSGGSNDSGGTDNSGDDGGSSDSDNSSGDGDSSDGDSSGGSEDDSSTESEENTDDSKNEESKDEKSDEKSEEKEKEEEVEEEKKEEEKEEEKEEKKEEQKEEEEEEEEKEKSLAPPIISANLVTMQMMDGVLQQAASFGYSQSSLTGLETYSANAMVWSNLKQYSINLSQSTVFFNYDKEVDVMINNPFTGGQDKLGSYWTKGSIMFVQSVSAGYMRMYSTHIGTVGISNVYLGKADTFWEGFVGGVAATGMGVFLEGGEVITTAAFTAFGTKPFNLKRLTVSPMLAYSHSPFTYAFKAKQPTWSYYGTYIIGSNFDFKLSQRFNANIGGTVIGNTQPGIPMSYAITVGSRFAF